MSYSVIASLPMKQFIYIPVLAACLMVLSACSGSEVSPEENAGQQETATQQFTVVVESIGEFFPTTHIECRSRTKFRQIVTHHCPL